MQSDQELLIKFFFFFFFWLLTVCRYLF